MAAIRDSGYKQVTAGNVATDFTWGAFPLATDDDRASSPSFNATGGGTGDTGWSTTTDIQSAKLTADNYSLTQNQLTVKAPADGHVRATNKWDAFPNFVANKNFNPSYTLQATITSATGNGTTVTYVANNAFTTGQSVVVSGLYNFVLVNGAATYTTASAYNISGTIASATSTGFTITNAAQDTTLATLVSSTSGVVAGTAIATVAASSATTTVPNIVGTSYVEADRLLDLAGLNNGTLTWSNVAKLTAPITAISSSGTTVTYTATNTFSVGQKVLVSGATNVISITGITASAGIVTYATSSTAGLVAGQTVVVTGSTTTAYNGTYTILAVTANTNFTVTSAATGATSTATGTLSGANAAFNIGGVVASASGSQFTITNAAAGSTSTGTATVTFVDNTVVSQTVAAGTTPALGTLVSYTVYRPAAGETLGTGAQYSI